MVGNTDSLRVDCLLVKPVNYHWGDEECYDKWEIVQPYDCEDYLNESVNEGGERRVQIESEDYAVIKALLENGGTRAVDAFIDATWSAWYCAESLTQAVDGLFHITNFGKYNKEYDEVVEKMIGGVFKSMQLALVTAETQVQYDDDPTDEAENHIESFGYGLSKRLEDI